MSINKDDNNIHEAVKAVDPTFEAILKSREVEFTDDSFAPFATLLAPGIMRFLEAYRGGNGFLNSVKKQASTKSTLSTKQLRASANIVWRSLKNLDLSQIQGSTQPSTVKVPEEGTALNERPSGLETNACYTCNKWIVGSYRYLMDVHKPNCRPVKDGNEATKWEENGSKNTTNIERKKPEFMLDLRLLPERGRYAVELPGGDHEFFIIEKLKRERKLSGRFNWSKYPSRVYQRLEVGTVIVRKQSGETRELVGMQLLTDDYFVGEYESKIKLICDDPVKAMILYGQIIGSCAYCGRSLTDDESRKHGIGPDCMENKHIPFLTARGNAALQAQQQGR